MTQPLAIGPDAPFVDPDAALYTEQNTPLWYPERYAPNTVEQQIDILRSSANFPFLNPDKAIRYYREAYAGIKMPEWVEGPFVIVPLPAFQRHLFSDITDPAGLMCLAVNMALQKLEASRPYINWRREAIVPNQFRRKPEWVPLYERLYASQPESDFIVVPGQYGMRHRGLSMRSASALMQETPGELPAGSLEGAVMALANPSRYFGGYNALYTDLPADECRPYQEPRYSFSGYFDMYLDEGVEEAQLRYDMCGRVGGYGRFGTVSFYVPE